MSLVGMGVVRVSSVEVRLVEVGMVRPRDMHVTVVVLSIQLVHVTAVVVDDRLSLHLNPFVAPCQLFFVLLANIYF